MGELVKYSEVERDRVEKQLAIEANKVNLMERRNAGLRAILYHLMRENVSLVYVEDERTNTAAEFVVPNKGCLEAWKHAFAHPNANLSPYLQHMNGSEDV